MSAPAPCSAVVAVVSWAVLIIDQLFWSVPMPWVALFLWLPLRPCYLLAARTGQVAQVPWWLDTPFDLLGYWYLVVHGVKIWDENPGGPAAGPELLCPNIKAFRGAVLMNHRSWGDFVVDPVTGSSAVVARGTAVVAMLFSGVLSIATNRIIIMYRSRGLCNEPTTREVCMYVNIRRHQHTRVHARTGRRRHARAPACRTHHTPRLVRRGFDASAEITPATCSTRRARAVRPSPLRTNQSPCASAGSRIYGCVSLPSGTISLHYHPLRLLTGECPSPAVPSPPPSPLRYRSLSPGPRPSFGGELGWPSYGPHRLGRSIYGPYPSFCAAVVSPCRCEPLRAGCCGGGGGVRCFVGVNLSSSCALQEAGDEALIVITVGKENIVNERTGRVNYSTHLYRATHPPLCAKDHKTLESYLAAVDAAWRNTWRRAYELRDDEVDRIWQEQHDKLEKV